VASTGTAVNRWVIGYRELVKRNAVSPEAELAAQVPVLAPPSVPAPARVLLPSHVRKVAPLEQH
jgi:hypothetical protein